MGGAKQARQAYQHRTEQRKVCIELINTPEVFSQVVKFKQASGGMDVTTQANGLKDRKAQAHGGHKAWQSLDLDRQTWIKSIEASKKT